MSNTQMLHDFLAGAQVEPTAFALRPDYRSLLVAVDGLVPGPSEEGTDALLQEAEATGRALLAEQPVEELPHVAAWREAYRAFGAKPQRTRNSLEALLRRTDAGLPRVNRLTDIYNAVSVLHQLPLGREDLACYTGAPRLIRAVGNETFDTTANGNQVNDHPEVGEVVWCDDAGVTCRRWNWRQSRRTQLHDGTIGRTVILDALAPADDDALVAAAADLISQLHQLGPDVQVVHRLIGADSAPGGA
jgi:DNA/RNA-binding domain of Phe-tRNA-synthetase-like protein